MFIVRANIPFGPDDTYDCEYSGIEHNTKADAEKELKKANKDENINYAYIEELED